MTDVHEGSSAEAVLLSHPQRRLADHVADVRTVAAQIAAYHDGWLGELVVQAALLHDVGKGTAAFQTYIRQPQGYRGDAAKKAHTPLGLLIVGRYAVHHQRPDEWLLAVGLAVLGHHSGLPTATGVEDKLDGDRWVGILLEQLRSLPLTALGAALGVTLDDLSLVAEKALLWQVAARYEDAFEGQRTLYRRDPAQAMARRLAVQYLFSVLLEADRAYLTLSAPGRTLYEQQVVQPWPSGLIAAYTARQPTTPLNAARTQARAAVLATLEGLEQPRLLTLTLPTGLGKTLAAAAVAEALRRRRPRPVVVVMPYLSIIDQTVTVYRDLLGLAEEGNSAQLMQSHSLSDRSYEAATEEGDAAFLLDTWSSDVVLTTVDQLLLALVGSHTRHALRFHHLVGSVLIIDEVQAIPTHLWDLCRAVLQGLAANCGTTVLAMSATQAGFIEGATELHPDPAALFRTMRRYRLVLRHRTPQTLEAFIASVRERQTALASRAVLIVLNTRASARAVFDALRDEWPTRVILLTADIVPRDRLAAIAALRERPEPVLVVATQVVEAGVDLDMDVVLRDMAPLDALIQVAGRCNRHGRQARGEVEVYGLTDERGQPFAPRIYRHRSGGPDYSLEATRAVLAEHAVLDEEAIFPIVATYFALLRQHKDLGERETRTYATFADDLDVSELLRGAQERRMEVIVAGRDPEGTLEAELRAALALPDRLRRRRRLRALAGRIAAVTVSIWVKRGWHPGQIADPLEPQRVEAGKAHEYPWWIVRDEAYDIERGLSTEDAFIL